MEPETFTAYNRIVGVPVVRAGVAMVPAFKSVVPTADIKLIGAKRHHDHNNNTYARSYLDELENEHVDSKSVYVLDTVLASGVSLGATIDILKGHGARDISVITGLAAPEGVAEINRQHPDAKVYTGCMAQGTNDIKYIGDPTPGDAGDNLFGVDEPWQEVVKHYKEDETLAYYQK